MDIVGGMTTVMRKFNDLMCNVIGLRVLGAGLKTGGTGDFLQTISGSGPTEKRMGQ